MEINKQRLIQIGIFSLLVLGLILLTGLDLPLIVLISLISTFLCGIITDKLHLPKGKERELIDVPTRDELVYQGSANLYNRGFSTAGKLFLTKSELIFKSHKLNFSDEKIRIPLNRIKTINFFRTMGIIPNGLELTLANGELKKFVVNKRSKWKEEIEQNKN